GPAQGRGAVLPPGRQTPAVFGQEVPRGAGLPREAGPDVVQLRGFPAPAPAIPKGRRGPEGSPGSSAASRGAVPGQSPIPGRSGGNAFSPGGGFLFDPTPEEGGGEYSGGDEPNRCPGGPFPPAPGPRLAAVRMPRQPRRRAGVHRSSERSRRILA